MHSYTYRHSYVYAHTRKICHRIKFGDGITITHISSILAHILASTKIKICQILTVIFPSIATIDYETQLSDKINNLQSHAS